MSHIRNHSVKAILLVVGVIAAIVLLVFVFSGETAEGLEPEEIQSVVKQVDDQVEEFDLEVVEEVVEEAVEEAAEEEVTATTTTVAPVPEPLSLRTLPLPDSPAAVLVDLRLDSLSDEETLAFEVFVMDEEEKEAFEDFVTPEPEPIFAPAPASSGGGMVCPFPGSSFSNSFGAARSGGRGHRGVDMMGQYGAPVYAPVSGTVSQGSDGLGGLNYKMNGDDGNYYYGAHLSSHGASGYVSAGTVIGYNGTSGNAEGAHLHFEVHVGGVPVNPYNYVIAAC